MFRIDAVTDIWYQYKEFIINNIV